MKYNVLTVASKAYLPFLDIFLTSFFKNGNIEDLNKLYVVDIDLGSYKDYLYKSDKIVYLDSNQKDLYSGIHSDGWYQNTSLKTRYLHHLLSSQDIQDPIILIDSDVLVLKDISNLINLDYDMQFTTMSEGSHIGGSGIEILHIGCFVICNNKEISKEFIELWIKTAQYLKYLNLSKPHETPAMNIVINIFKKKKVDGFEGTITKRIIEKSNINNINNIKIGFIDDRISCSDKSVHPQSRTLHFKTNGSTNVPNPFEDFQNRISNIDCFDPEAEKLDLNEYLNPDLFSLWLNDIEEK